MEQDFGDEASREAAVMESSSFGPPGELGLDGVDMSVSSGESTEVPGTEKRTFVLSKSESQSSLTVPLEPQVVRSKAVVSHRTISGDRHQVLSTCPSEALIPTTSRPAIQVPLTRGATQRVARGANPLPGRHQPTRAGGG